MTCDIWWRDIAVLQGVLFYKCLGDVSAGLTVVHTETLQEESKYQLEAKARGQPPLHHMFTPQSFLLIDRRFHYDLGSWDWGKIVKSEVLL